jgi:type III restriction enzyme
MELKKYQQQILDDLKLYLDNVQETRNAASAFNEFWKKHPRTPFIPQEDGYVKPYKIPSVKGSNIKITAPHVCIKVPTGGGKTFIATASLKTICSAFDTSCYKTVVWLVPSNSILEQTYKNLHNPDHPYRKRINADFQNRVEVISKEEALQGINFSSESVKENLTILVMSYDSLRSAKKDGRNVYKENGYLHSFKDLFNGSEDAVTLVQVLQKLHPIVIVDESHNAESDLSIDMLEQLSPNFILDLTATPKNYSNIISFTNASELKKNNMVKLPVIVYNLQNKNEVIESALQLQKSLENAAIEEEKNGGKYIRPIVLFQAQPKTKDDNVTFEKIKETLLKLKIKEEEIKIKTSSINEIEGIDLMDKSCSVRYIITVNALKEGWDCPFAYILASLADKSSSVDVEQILGRILRMPYVQRCKNQMLNMSYVLTASATFSQTLDNIVKGLNRAGFSQHDYRVASETPKATEEES